MLTDRTTYVYNQVGEQISMIDPMGDTTTFGYDAAGEQIQMTDPVGNVTDYSYNSVGEVSSQSVYGPSAGLVQKINYGYDPDGNLLSTATANLSTPPENLSASTNDTNISGSYTGVLGGSISGAFSSSFSGSIVNGSQVIGDYTAILSGDISGTLSSSGVLSGTEYGTLSIVFGDGLGGSSSCSFSNPLSGTNSGGTGSMSGVLSFALTGTLDSSGGVGGTFGNSLSVTFSGGGGVSGPVAGTLSGVEGESATSAYNAIGEATSVTDALGDVTTYSYDKNGNVTTVTGSGQQHHDHHVQRTERAGQRDQ